MAQSPEEQLKKESGRPGGTKGGRSNRTSLIAKACLGRMNQVRSLLSRKNVQKLMEEEHFSRKTGKKDKRELSRDGRGGGARALT